jgi:hypothetical protein
VLQRDYLGSVVVAAALNSQRALPQHGHGSTSTRAQKCHRRLGAAAKQVSFIRGR